MAELPANYDELTSIQKIEFHFPALRGGCGYRDTSAATIEYNCLAWALGITWACYAPERCAGYVWFPGVEREWNVETITRIFQNHGFEKCNEYEPEDGYEKVVFYVDESGSPQHFARQISGGKWTSKLGELNDIEHDNLDCLAVADYGRPERVLRREIRPKEPIPHTR